MFLELQNVENLSTLVETVAQVPHEKNKILAMLNLGNRLCLISISGNNWVGFYNKEA